MEKKQILTLMMVIIFSSLVLSGCSENSRGTFGPAWDVAYKVPITRNEGKTAKELVEDNEEIINNNGLIQYSKTEEMDIIDVGAKLTEVALPSVNQIVALPLIKLDNLINGNQDISIPAGVSSDSGKTSTIIIDKFDSIEFSNNATDESNNPINQMGVVITAPDDFDIDSATLTFKDGSTILGDITFNSIAKGTKSSKQFINLANSDITGDLTVELSNLSTSGISSNSGAMNLAYSIDQAEVSKVVNYGNLAPTELSQSINVASIEAGLEAVAFSSGELNLALGLPENSNLTFEIQNLTIGTIFDSSSDNKIDLDLANESINLVNGMEIDFKLIVSGTNVTYDTSQNISVIGGFSPDSQIASVTVDNSLFDFTDANQTLDEEILTEVPEDISTISLNGAIARFVIDGYDIENLLVNLDDVQFKAIYEDGSESKITLTEINGGSAVIDSINSEISLLNDSQTDFLDWLQGLASKEDITSVRLVGDAIVEAVDSVTIDTSDKLTPKVEIEVPFDITLNNNIEDRAIPETVNDSLSNDDVEQIDNYFKNGQLIIEDFKNDLPVNVEVTIYLGKVSEWQGKDLDSYLDNLSEIDKERELDKLYKASNKFKSFTLTKQDSGEKKVVDLTASDADWLTDDNLYVGVKYKVTGDNIEVKSTDEVTINNLYAKLVVKVNQDKE